jgi:very-short-patch-repair endonuclease
MRHKIHPFNPNLRLLARKLRKNSTLSEVLFWLEIKKKTFGYEFHRKVPIGNYIVDFFCHELQLAVGIDGNSHDYKYNCDDIRQSKLEEFGVTVLRFNDLEKKCMNDILRELEKVISEIERGRTSP